MGRVLGIGGVFVKCKEPEHLYRWYERHLGLTRNEGGGAVMLPWRSVTDGSEHVTVWSLFPKDTRYFGSSPSCAMMNFIVDDLDAILDALRKDGVPVDPHIEKYEYGRFAWITDPEGNRVELWEPKRPATAQS